MDTPSYNRPAPSRPTAFKTFEDLEVYQAAREFRKAIYELARQLPDIEKFGLANQMRRAAVSLTNNIAEGHGRYHYLDEIRFVLNSRGSLEELIDDLNTCGDEHYLPPEAVSQIKAQGWRVHQLINGYLRYLRSRKQGGALELRESVQADAPLDNDLEALCDQYPQNGSPL